ncbi:acetyl-CoA carboxylase biotin carboxylase subunit [Burkholderia pseudomallei]|nr:acetyl-CoA carboxylase biotin carboxylase subunit [Burkholderia pseudomallei]
MNDLDSTHASFYRPSRIGTVLVANRGEIAVRVIRAAHELGMRAVAAVSDADRDSLAARMADEAVHIGPSHAAKSYLDPAAMLAAARQCGADAIHPGYGFLSENADFAAQVEAAGLIFVGPPARVIATMGDKARARETARRAGVPTVPGSEGVVASLDGAREVAARIGYPVMIKAAAGGGGRGIRVAHDAAQLAAQLPLAQREAQAAFGDGGVYLERFIARARHIEVQILGDGENVIHLFERECSLQRRRQKILEEAPSPSLTPALRDALCASATRLARQVSYRGAGTLEYLFDDARGELYFIEMNTRIQVEHPVTEAVTGVDLVREMLRIADGEPLRFAQGDIALRGAALECRINAEDPLQDFRPNPGRIDALVWPAGPGVRIDSLLYPGYTVPPFYDSLLAKLIVHDESRPAALARAARALRELRIDGVKTTAPLHRALLDDADVRAGRYHTNYLEAWMRDWLARLDARASAPRGLGEAAFGGDEFIFVEISESMSLDAFFKGTAITRELRRRNVPGVTEICPANASYQVRYDPDVIEPDTLFALLKTIEAEVGEAALNIDTRIVEVPVLYNDPWTHETLMRFRERHQAPESTDLEYAARVNGKRDIDEFIAAHAGSPWFVSMVGFVAGLPFMYQMVERERQLQVPKYLRPRTDTPKLTVGHGGCFGCIYSVRGAGGYQMFGVTPAPIFDPAQRLDYLRDFMVFFRPGDIVKFKPIDRAEYDAAVAAVEAGTFTLRVKPVRFALEAFLRDPHAYNRSLVEVLDAN